MNYRRIFQQILAGLLTVGLVAVAIARADGCCCRVQWEEIARLQACCASMPCANDVQLCGVEVSRIDQEVVIAPITPGPKVQDGGASSPMSVANTSPALRIAHSGHGGPVTHASPPSQSHSAFSLPLRL